MKHTIKTAFILLSCIAIFVTSSCERELYNRAINYDGKSIIRKVNIDDLPLLKNVINEKINKNKLTAKDRLIGFLS